MSDILKSDKKTPALMFQGTCSNAGKSLMTVAYCRILSDMGYRVAPFKAQNMSLNSAVTASGGEMGRAQALQAKAARQEPHCDMNPLLLKPNTDTGAQVIVNGKVWENREAQQYYASRDKLWPEICAAYDRLASRYDVIVLEGAGSPGEVNLKKFDMVNMPMARYADSSVILVGDIDRGGTYASFIGHYTVMDKWERDLLAGFMVNKFRGDASLLHDAHRYMVDHTGKPVMGIMPYCWDHRLPEEDGVDFEEKYRNRSSGKTQLRIGVLELPHISNSTDIDPLLDYPQCELIRISTVEQLKENNLHLLILPGSKNVIGDLHLLKKRGLIDEIIRLYKKKALCLLGICAGFQILGREIIDPQGIEGAKGSGELALDILPMKTELAKDKTLKQTETYCALAESKVKGYEIHHGVSTYGSSSNDYSDIACSEPDKELFSTPGLGTWGNGVWGTYLHGILENDSFTKMILEQTARYHGISGDILFHRENNLEKAIDNFAAVFRESVDMDFILRATGL